MRPVEKSLPLYCFAEIFFTRLARAQRAVKGRDGGRLNIAATPTRASPRHDDAEGMPGHAARIRRGICHVECVIGGAWVSVPAAPERICHPPKVPSNFPAPHARSPVSHGWLCGSGADNPAHEPASGRPQSSGPCHGAGSPRYGPPWARRIRRAGSCAPPRRRATRTALPPYRRIRTNRTFRALFLYGANRAPRSPRRTTPLNRLPCDR